MADNTNQLQENTGAGVSANEISKAGIVAGGLLIVLFIVLPILLLMAYWPDRLPSSAHENAAYKNVLFHVCLIDNSSKTISTTSNVAVDTSKKGKRDSLKKDTPDKAVAKKTADKGVKNKGVDSVPAKDLVMAKSGKSGARLNNSGSNPSTISLNFIFLILVAAAGFLGNMIHIATSFSNFIGANKFKKTWMLWYFIKPFSASALAVIFYFVLRAGFFSSNDNGANINLYGVITVAALAGLFTDMAMLKLKDVFDVLFKVKDNLPNKLNETGT